MTRTTLRPTDQITSRLANTLALSGTPVSGGQKVLAGRDSGGQSGSLFTRAWRSTQRLSEVSDEVSGVFKPAREAHHPINNAPSSSLFGRQTVMRGRDRLRDQTFHSA
jgi:hypothetical protein